MANVELRSFDSFTPVHFGLSAHPSMSLASHAAPFASRWRMRNDGWLKGSGPTAPKAAGPGSISAFRINDRDRRGDHSDDRHGDHCGGGVGRGRNDHGSN